MEQTAAAQEVGPGGVPRGAQTHQYYKTENIPDRFDNPVKRIWQVSNQGNPVASCPYPQDIEMPEASPLRAGQDYFKGYGGKKQHPMYMTTAAGYGSKTPSVHTMPTQFYARSQKFSEHLGSCGMYRNYSLNTEPDKSVV